MSAKTDDQPIADKTVVVTGTLENYTREEIKRLIELAGGDATGSVSKNTDYLVTGDKPGGKKLAKAKKLGVAILSENDIEGLLQAQKPIANKTVVVTGTLENYTREEIHTLIEQSGGDATGSVSKNTDYLVAGENPGSKKLAEAKKLGVAILSEREFVGLVQPSSKTNPEPENSGVAYVKTMADGLDLGSDSDAAPETFDVAIPANADSEQLRTSLLEFARSSDYASGWGTSDRYDHDRDYYATKGLSPLFPDRKSSESQGWYTFDADYGFGNLTYTNYETDESEEVYDKVLEAFKQSTRVLEELVIYSDPDKYGESSNGVYILSGVDRVSGRLVGFMLQCVQT